MILRLALIGLLAISALMVDTSTAEAGWRRRCRRSHLASTYYAAPVRRASYGPRYGYGGYGYGGYGYGPRVHLGVGIGYYGW